MRESVVRGECSGRECSERECSGRECSGRECSERECSVRECSGRVLVVVELSVGCRTSVTISGGVIV